MEQMDLKEYLVTLLKHWWLILLTTVLAGGAAILFSTIQAPVYEATTTIEISPGADPNRDVLSIAASAERAAMTFAEQLKSPIILCEAADQLDLRLDECGEDEVTVQQARSTNLIHVSAENTDPALARAHADMVVQILIERETNKQQAGFQSGLDDLDRQIAEVEVSLAENQRAIASLQESPDLDEAMRLALAQLEIELSSDQTRLSTLLGSTEDFRLAMARYTDNISVFSPARLPAEPVRPRVMVNTALGVVLGLMTGVGAALLLEYLDDTIKSSEDVKRTLPVGVLGVLPEVSGPKGEQPGLIVAREPRRPVAEAFRNLRTSIRYFSLDRPAKTILVTSPVPNNGKSFTAANLAVSLAQGGQSVVLVDADLRRPVQQKMFDLPNGVGLTSTLLNMDEAEASFQQTETEGLRVITSGDLPPNPAELLGSRRMQQFISWLTEQVDVVIIDSPPLLAFADAAVLSRIADSTILVVQYGKTRRQEAVQAVERLAEIGGTLSGVVINQVAASADNHYYSYRYYNDYYGDDGHDEKDGWRHFLRTRLSRPERNGD